MAKKRAPRNRTLTLSDEDVSQYKPRLIKLDELSGLDGVLDRTINQDSFDVLDLLPRNSVDLVFVDPPYNLTKNFNGVSFKARSQDAYEDWLEHWIPRLVPILKQTASIYVCGDWRSSSAIHRVLERYFIVRNRITWEREKGRGAKSNWKNASEDIWFATVSNEFTFNVGNVKLKRRVVAPYTDTSGEPKDWEETNAGRFRLTHPSNLWTDLTIPFWSMPENTDHPTQKPEKLVAKIVLASSNKGDVVLDPFLGSGTTSVVAKKLQRHFIGVEIDTLYCCLAEKRLELAEVSSAIQGYAEGVFWERNTLSLQKQSEKSVNQSTDTEQISLF